MENTSWHFLLALSTTAIFNSIIIFAFIRLQRLKFWPNERNEDGEINNLSFSKEKENDTIKESLMFILLYASILGTVFTLGNNWGIPWWDNFYYGATGTDIYGSISFWIVWFLVIVAIIAKELAHLPNNFKLIFKIFLCIIALIILSNLVSAFISARAYSHHKTKIVIVNEDQVLPSYQLHISAGSKGEQVLPNDYCWTASYDNQVKKDYRVNNKWVFVAGEKDVNVEILATCKHPNHIHGCPHKNCGDKCNYSQYAQN